MPAAFIWSPLIKSRQQEMLARNELSNLSFLWRNTFPIKTIWWFLWLCSFPQFFTVWQKLSQMSLNPLWYFSPRWEKFLRWLLLWNYRSIVIVVLVKGLSCIFVWHGTLEHNFILTVQACNLLRRKPYWMISDFSVMLNFVLYVWFKHSCYCWLQFVLFVCETAG